MSTTPWSRRGGVLVATGPIDEPDERELTAYRYCATPVDERQHPKTCGRTGNGRSGHYRLGEPVCQDCATAERLYSADRRRAS